MPRINAFKDLSKDSIRRARHTFRDYFITVATIETIYMIFKWGDSKICEHACFSVVVLT